MSPAWHLFATPATNRALPSVMQKLMLAAENYYYEPFSLPTLANLNGKRNLDGQPRLNRSEAREAETLILSAIIHLTEFASLKVGTPLPSGEFVNRSCVEIARVAGMIDSKSPADNPQPEQRFWRGFRRLKNAGAFDVHLQYEKIAGEFEKGSNGKMKQKMRARPAIKNVNFHFLVAMGAVSYDVLKKFRTYCSNKLKKSRQLYRTKNPECNDANIARRKVKEIQALGGTITNLFKKKRSKAIPDSNKDKELMRQYTNERTEYMSNLIKDGEDFRVAKDKTLGKYGTFDEWSKTKIA